MLGNGVLFSISTVCREKGTAVMTHHRPLDHPNISEPTTKPNYYFRYMFHRPLATDTSPTPPTRVIIVPSSPVRIFDNESPWTSLENQSITPAGFSHIRTRNASWPQSEIPTRECVIPNKTNQAQNTNKTIRVCFPHNVSRPRGATVCFPQTTRVFFSFSNHSTPFSWASVDIAGMKKRNSPPLNDFWKMKLQKNAIHTVCT